MTWWQGAVGYEIYIRSFADGDGDGVGDIAGIRAKLPVLAELGVDVIWITPWYPSPLHDGGYDVADYRDIHPLYGDLADAEALVEEAHALGMRVLADLVPNHSSSEHPWFRRARSSRDDPYRDYYVWRDPGPDGGPPNNWVAHFGGPAWTFDEATGQYWLHLFLPEQPDLNWANPRVQEEFLAILEFWFARGIDGFRVDVAHALTKDPELRDLPLVDEPPPADADPVAVWRAYDHVHDVDQQGTPAIYRSWRELADRYDALLVGEVYLLELERVARYIRDQDGLHSALCIPTVKTGWDADAIRRVLVAGNEHHPQHLTWTQSSHDDARAPTRFGGGARGRARALAYLTLLAGMPGFLMLYQGDELLLENADVSLEDADDPIARRSGATVGSRDPVRTPMPWEPGPGFGFTTGRPWLPFGDRRDEDTVAVQRHDPASPWSRTRDLLATRRHLADLRSTEPAVWLDGGAGDVIAYRRGDTVVAANGGETAADLAGLPLGTAHQVAFASDGASDAGSLAPGAAVILVPPA